MRGFHSCTDNSAPRIGKQELEEPPQDGGTGPLRLSSSALRKCLVKAGAQQPRAVLSTPSPCSSLPGPCRNGLLLNSRWTVLPQVSPAQLARVPGIRLQRSPLPLLCFVVPLRLLFCFLTLVCRPGSSVTCTLLPLPHLHSVSRALP